MGRNNKIKIALASKGNQSPTLCDTQCDIDACSTPTINSFLESPWWNANYWNLFPRCPDLLKLPQMLMTNMMTDRLLAYMHGVTTHAHRGLVEMAGHSIICEVEASALATHGQCGTSFQRNRACSGVTLTLTLWQCTSRWKDCPQGLTVAWSETFTGWLF